VLSVPIVVGGNNGQHRVGDRDPRHGTWDYSDHLDR
jgi:hypothetical protein